MSVPRTAGHSRGARTLTATLMTDLLTLHFTKNHSEPSVHAHQIMTAPPGMAWLRAIGDIASNTSLSVRTKVSTITSMVEARLAEHGAPPLTLQCDDDFNRNLTAILDGPDPAVAHNRLVREVCERIEKLLAPLAQNGVVLDYDQLVANFQQRVKITLVKVRDDEYTLEPAEAIIFIRLGILLAKLQIDVGLDDADIMSLEEDLWSLLRPYHPQENTSA